MSAWLICAPRLHRRLAFAGRQVMTDPVDVVWQVSGRPNTTASVTAASTATSTAKDDAIAAGHDPNERLPISQPTRTLPPRGPRRPLGGTHPFHSEASLGAQDERITRHRLRRLGTRRRDRGDDGAKPVVASSLMSSGATSAGQRTRAVVPSCRWHA